MKVGSGQAARSPLAAHDLQREYLTAVGAFPGFMGKLSPHLKLEQLSLLGWARLSRVGDAEHGLVIGLSTRAARSWQRLPSQPLPSRRARHAKAQMRCTGKLGGGQHCHGLGRVSI